MALRKRRSFRQLLVQFANSDDSLRVYDHDKLIFQSRKEKLVPLLDYLRNFVPRVKGVVVIDRVVGNAAALLLKEASCTEVYGLLGSRLAAQTLDNFGIRHHFYRVVANILNGAGSDICPMEKLSIGKTPEEFYAAVRQG